MKRRCQSCLGRRPTYSPTKLFIVPGFVLEKHSRTFILYIYIPRAVHRDLESDCGPGRPRGRPSRATKQGGASAGPVPTRHSHQHHHAQDHHLCRHHHRCFLPTLPLPLPPRCRPLITLPGWQWLLPHRHRCRPWSSVGLFSCRPYHDPLDLPLLPTPLTFTLLLRGIIQACITVPYFCSSRY